MVCFLLSNEVRAVKKEYDSQLSSRPANIRELALVVREVCEWFAFSLEAKDYDFHEREDLQSMCVLATAVLAMVYATFGIDVTFISGAYRRRNCSKKPAKFPHCYLELDKEGVRVDITATQFHIPDKVYITPLDSSGCYIEGTVIQSFKQLLWLWDESHVHVSQDIVRLYRMAVERLVGKPSAAK